MPALLKNPRKPAPTTRRRSAKAISDPTPASPSANENAEGVSDIKPKRTRAQAKTAVSDEKAEQPKARTRSPRKSPEKGAETGEAQSSGAVPEKADSPPLVPMTATGAGKSSTPIAEDPVQAAMRLAQPDPNPTYRIRMMPDMARSLLARNTSNRTPSQQHAQFFMRIILGGNWDPNNGGLLAISEEGEILQGQHRLMGCVLANMPIDVDIKFNVPKSSQKTMDIMRPRTVADQLAINGIKNALQTAAAARWVFAFGTGYLTYKTSPSEVIELLEKFPSLRESINAARGVKHVSISLIAAIHFIGSTILGEKTKADAFVEVFRDGVQSYHLDPAHNLREIFIGVSTKKARFSQRSQTDMVVHAWNLFRANKTVKRGPFSAPEGVKIEGFEPDKMGIMFQGRVPIETTTLENGAKIPERADTDAA